MSMDSKDSALVALSPPSTLVFQLERGTEPRSILKVTNVSSTNVVFKVKTTQPSWYYVRPNQQILAPGQSEDVKVLLVGTECNRFLDQAANNAEVKLDKHRFLVQSKVVDGEDYSRIMELPVAQRSEEFSQLWETNKDDRRNAKLKVDFKYLNASERAAAGGGAKGTGSTGSGGHSKSAPSVSENVESVRSRLAEAGAGDGAISSSNGGTSSSGSGGPGSGGAFAANSPEMMFAELQSVRKKYDAVVEYTVHLTAERDAIVAQLETAQRELAREKAAKKKNGEVGLVGSKKGGEKGEKKIIEKGFSLIVVLITALICFLIGKYLS